MAGKIAFVFPGQGSQSVGMLTFLANEFPIIVNTFKQASNVLNYDLWELVEHGPEERLNQTEFTQPALLAAGVAIWQLCRQTGKPLPSYLAGHSLGEYTALVCAEVLSFEDAISLVAMRGKLMQAAVPAHQGAMAAIVGLTDQQVENICQEAARINEPVSPANYNAIGQIVVAGYCDAVNRVIQLAQQAGAILTKILPVSVPSHCSLMEQAANELANNMNSIPFNLPTLPVVHNVDAQIHVSAQLIREALTAQLYKPVRWVESIQFLKNQGVDTIYECGPGNVLSGLIKRIDKSIKTYSLNQLDCFK